LANLQRLHAAAELLAKQAPELIGNREVARGMEQILMQALAGCPVSSDMHEQTPTQKPHQKIMQRFHTMVSIARQSG
jgi:hypothetical protein